MVATMTRCRQPRQRRRQSSNNIAVFFFSYYSTLPSVRFVLFIYFFSYTHIVDFFFSSTYKINFEFMSVYGERVIFSKLTFCTAHTFFFSCVNWITELISFTLEMKDRQDHYLLNVNLILCCYQNYIPYQRIYCDYGKI